MRTPTFRDSWQEQDGDGATSCSCSHCATQGRLEQGTDCRYYRSPTPEPLQTINRAQRTIPRTR